ncbi:glycoside hydrolase, partial [Thozetella sp. PMI_491]
RIVQYYAKQFEPNSGDTKKVSILPLVNSSTGGHVTNIIMGTWYLRENGTMRLNGFDPDNSSLSWLWPEVKKVQKAGVPVTMMMLDYWSLVAKNSTSFETCYRALHDTLAKYGFDGIDLDIEDKWTADDEINPNAIKLDSVINLIDRLKSDFGPDFLITLAPVASALSGGQSLSVFNYKELERQRGSSIAWYNAQFYNYHGFAGTPGDYIAIIDNGWSPDRVVLGMATNYEWHGAANLTTKVPHTIRKLTAKYPNFGGVDGWDYIDALPGGYVAPWKWAE